MNVDHYDLITNAGHMDFEFESVGPQGKIRKGITYTLQRNVNYEAFMVLRK